jgi:hypothetical protein
MRKSKSELQATLGKTLLLMLMIAMQALSSCATMERYWQAATAPSTRPGRNAYEHTVRWPGENLSLIAKWYTGDQRNRKALTRVNPGIEPNALRIGDTVLIPANLLTTRQPMPRSFVSSKVQKPRRSDAAAASPADTEPAPVSDKEPDRGSAPEAPPPSQPLELFGPKE